ncbi:MAG: hypothetical protein KIG88_06465 [Weeksellaceae bacterium]|nr:hypothetical protein [Weeksellaceae bacterium]
MKKLGLLAAVAMLAVSCSSKPGGNKGVLPVEHEAYTADDVHHRTEAIAGGHHGEDHKEVKEEVKTDSAAVVVEEVKTDSVK